MPKITTSERVSIWRHRIKLAQEIRKDLKARIVDPNVQAYRGEATPSWWNTDDPWVNVRLVFSAIRASIPSLIYQNPTYTISPTKPSFVQNPQGGDPVDVSFEKAKSQELWLNHWFGASNGALHARLAVLKAFLSMGVVKVGYRPSFADDEKRGVLLLDDDGNLELDGNGDPKLKSGEYVMGEDHAIMRDEDGVPVLHPGELQGEDFFTECVDWENMLYDPDGREDFELHRWVGEEWVRPLNEVRNDPRFSKKVRESIEPTETVLNFEDPTKEVGLGLMSQLKGGVDDLSGPVQDDFARVRGYDLYDFAEDRYYVLAEQPTDGDDSNDVFLLDEPTPPGIKHGPYVHLKFNEDPGEWFPKTEAEGMANVQMEYNITRSQGMIHREHTKTRYLYTEGTFADEDGGDAEMLKLETGPDAALIKVAALDGLVPLQKANLDGSYFAAVPNILNDFNLVAGQPGEARGVADADTATQANILAVSNDVRNSDRRDNIVQKALNEIGQKLLESGQANADLPTFVKIAGENATDPFRFHTVEPEDIQDLDFDVDIVVGSTLPLNDPRLAQTVMQFLTIFGQNPGIALSTSLIERVLKSMSLPPEIAAELKQAAEQMLEQQQSQQAGPTGQAGQVLQAQLGGNASAGAPTGAAIN